jgi:hypothetical protein
MTANGGKAGLDGTNGRWRGFWGKPTDFWEKLLYGYVGNEGIFLQLQEALVEEVGVWEERNRQFWGLKKKIKRSYLEKEDNFVRIDRLILAS